MKNEKDKKKLLEGYAKYSSIAFQMIAIILLGVFGGIQLDKITGWEFPLFTIILSIFSVILAIYYVTKDLMKGKNEK